MRTAYRLHCWWLFAAVLVNVLAELDSRAPKVQEPEEPKGYLLPIIRGYANNQIVGLKEVLALGQILGRTVVLTGLLESYFEEPAKNQPRVIELQHVFDTGAVEKRQAVIHMSKLRQTGWDGHLDLVAFFNGKGSDELWLKRWSTGFNVSLEGVTRMELHGFHCQEKWIKHIQEQFKGQEMVGISTFEGVVGEHPRRPGSHWRFETLKGKHISRCHENYYEVTRALRRSAHLRKLADEYIDVVLKGGPFVALHVRPYPDACLKVWQHPQFDGTRAVGLCDKPAGNRVHEVLGPAMKEAMDALGAAQLFVMAEPSIRHQVDSMLKEYDIKPHYFPLGALLGDRIEAGASADQAATQSDDLDVEKAVMQGVSQGRLEEEKALKKMPGVISVLGILEEEVALRSKVFFATSGTSSMAGMVIQERQAQGIQKNLTITFDQLGSMDPDMWPKPWSA